ncbi:MAG TPA: tRNA cytidylyltransferase [Gemmatimonadetes bacterium]|nr:tRNA cytidylyltransferase [Gemmatimonadota bacterium]|tara:strand:+ start:7891 stop:9213 length:1323 start_codon:yes stop_codon:yes gene_type:complete
MDVRVRERMVRRHPSAPAAVGWIARTLEGAGFETWAVGGAVRDVLLGVESVDWDLATRARPEQVRHLFRRTVPVGIEHGTIGVLARDGTMYDVTTFRRDVETHGRHATVEFADYLDDDLSRRDFTINAVAWHPLRDELYDPFGGVEDMERGILRTVGSPPDRLAEDYLRVLRALRFAGRFELTVDQATWDALCAATDQLGILSPERVREELLKVLAGDSQPSRALSLYAAAGVLDPLMPELAELVGAKRGEVPVDAWSYALLLVDALLRQRPILRLTALLQATSPRAAAQLLIRLRFSNAQADTVVALVRAGPGPPPATATPSDKRRWLSRVGAARLPELARIWCGQQRVERALGMTQPTDAAGTWRAFRRELRKAPPLAVSDLAVDGNDLIRAGIMPGPHFGKILEALLERVLGDPSLNRREGLLAMATELAIDTPDRD